MAGPTITNRFPQVTAQIEGDIEDRLRSAALQVEALAKLRAPVDTGFLRNSISAQRITAKRWVVEAGAYYAPYVEYGTVRAAAQPFLRPALEVVKAQIAGRTRY